MSSIFDDGTLHPGRDANDSWWMVVRRAEQWGQDPRSRGDGSTDADYHTPFDSRRGLLELTPLPLGDAARDPVSITAADGTSYLLDPTRHLLLRRRLCDADWSPLPGVGGFGANTASFNAPRGLAIDGRGYVYVADTANHRVQVIDPHVSPARIVMVLGVSPVLSGLTSSDSVLAGPAAPYPVAVAVSSHWLYVVGEDGWTQVYDLAFRPAAAFLARRPAGLLPRVVGAAILGEDVVIADAHWSTLSRFDCRGQYLSELSLSDAPEGLLHLRGLGRYQPEGSRVVGPIDGGEARLAWHHVVVEGEFPPGTEVEVQTWAADAVETALPMSPSVPPPFPVTAPWAPVHPVALPMPHEPRSGGVERPVHSDVGAWERTSNAPYSRGFSFGLHGTGPSASNTFTLPVQYARFLRAGDTLELGQPRQGTTTATLESISPRSLGVVAKGDRGVFVAGSELRLLRRDGRSLDDPRIAILTDGEQIDLSTIPVDDGGADVEWPHRLAALLCSGDVLELNHADTGQHVRVHITSMDASPATITLAEAVSSDLRFAQAVLLTRPGRLVFSQSEGWGDGFPVGSTVALLSTTGASHNATVAWSDPLSHTVWLDAALPELAPPEDWVSMSPVGKPQATDRGRYLWIKLTLRGALAHPADSFASATPSVRSLRVVAPRHSYLKYLPAVFARRDAVTPTGSLFLERFLALMEARLTRIEAQYEAVARWLNPHAADDEWLAFVASWFDLVLDVRWPRAARARLLSQVVELYRLRGTREGILRFVEVYTGKRPELVEGFQLRPGSGLILGCAGVLGCSPLGGLAPEATGSEGVLSQYAHRCVLVAHLDDECDADLARLSLRTLVDAVKPAHVDVELDVAVPQGRIGFESTVGINFVLGDATVFETPLGTDGRDGSPGSILGVNLSVAHGPRSGGLDTSYAPTQVGNLALQ